MPQEEERLVEELTRWTSSDEGKKAIKEAFKKAEDMNRRLREARRVSRERMMEPVTI